jgi:hypothetical protein
MRFLGILIALAACASKPKGESPFEACVLSGEERRPPLDEVAVLVVVTPPEYDARGICVVTRLRDLKTGREVEPALRYQLVELDPGRYEASVYYWVQRSRIQRDATGQPKLLMEDLRSLQPAPLRFTAKAGHTYWVSPRILVDAADAPGELGFWQPTIYGKHTGYDPSPPPAEYEVTDDYLWRPTIAELEGEAAAKYRRYR